MVAQAQAQLEVTDSTRIDALGSLVPEWAALWSRCPDAGVFQLPDWMLPFLGRFAPGRAWVLAVRRGGVLVGLAPMFIEDEPQGRKLMLLGTGISDHLDALAAPRMQRTVAQAIMEHLAAHAHRWDLADFQQIPAEGVIATAPSAGVGHELRQQDVCPVLALPGHVDELAHVIPERHHHNIAYYRRRVERLSTVRYEQATERSFESLFTALAELHAARWQARGTAGVLADQTLQAFHREAAWLLLRRGVLRLYAMHVDGRVAAGFYGFHCNRRTSYYLGGFDPQLARLNVGTLIVAHAIDRAVEESAAEFDFLRGNEPYKYAWGAVDRPTFQRLERHAGGGGATA